MISFDLKCDGDHVFEVWFRSSVDYENQRSAGQLLCPYCGSGVVSKAVMAPAVGAKGNRRAEPLPASESPERGPVAMGAADEAERIRTLMRNIADMQSHALKESQWVGGAFSERARAIYYGEAEPVTIHGTASPQEVRALAEEGLAVAPLLVPIAPPDQTN
ncbi:MAG TPA: DUF1178 family protein [Sphingobium sp.]|nr:DUF1178 family protein [Sphingobium sp.]